MALVNCPECGRERVSDSAVSCPACGFGVREYFLNNPEKRIQEQTVQSETEVQKAESPKTEPQKTTTTTKSIRCKKCGSFYPSKYDKCPGCGEKASSLSNGTNRAVSTSSESKAHIRVPKKNIFKRNYIIGIIIGLVVLIIGIPIINSFKKETATVSSKTTTEYEYATEEDYQMSEYEAKSLAIDAVENASQYELTPSNANYYRIENISVGSAELIYDYSNKYTFSVKGTYSVYNEYGTFEESVRFDAHVDVNHDGSTYIDYCMFN